MPVLERGCTILAKREGRIMRRFLRTAVVSMVVVLVVSSIVTVQAQTPDNGQANSAIMAQNKNTDVGNPDADAGVVATYLDPDGSTADSLGAVIPPLAAAKFLSSDAGVGEPWLGSMILYSDEELATVADLLWDNGAHGDGKTAAAYTGFSETSDIWYLPRVMVVHGTQVGQITVQNADSAPATVWIRYYFRGQSTPTAEISEVIEPGGSRFYDLGSPGGKVPDLTTLEGKSVWEGSAIVEAEDDRQLTAVCVTHWAGWAAAYVGTSQPSTHLIGPRLTRRAYDEGGPDLRWAEFGAIILQNPNDAAATVDVAFYDLETGNLDLLLENLSIGARTVKIIHLRQGQHVPVEELTPLDRDPGASIVWNGKVEATSDVPILGIVIDKRGDGAANEYNMCDVSQGSGVLYAPSIYRTISGGQGLYSRLAVANLSGDEATVDFYFYDRAGNLDLIKSRNIPGNGVKNFQLWHSMFADLGEDWEGSAYVTSDKAAVSIVDTLWKSGAERLSAYNAIND